jgi:hypothetical protein
MAFSKSKARRLSAIQVRVFGCVKSSAATFHTPKDHS